MELSNVLNCHSQLQDENHVGAVLKGVVEHHDVGVPDVPQDVHLTLDLLPPHPARAGCALALLDELCGELAAGALLPTSLYDGELSTETEGDMFRKTWRPKWFIYLEK